MDADVALLAARYRMGLLGGAELASSANKLLDRYPENSWLFEIAVLNKQTLRDAEPLLEKALRELDSSLPDRSEAIRLLIAHNLKSVVDRVIDPDRALHAVFYNLGLRDLDQEAIREMDLKGLLSCYWDYVQIEDDENPSYPKHEVTNETNLKTRELAKAWLDTHD